MQRSSIVALMATIEKNSLAEIAMDVQRRKASPTASPEAVLLALAREAREGRCVVTADVPNAFMQAELNDETGVLKLIV